MSTTATPQNLAMAQVIMARVLADLRPYCHQCEPAGSVRREKDVIGDLEVVAIPRREEQGGLFGDIPVNLLWAHLHKSKHYRWLKGDHEQGRYYQLALVDGGMHLDLFLAEPDNFGWIHLIRTGSADFSASMLARWKRVQAIGPDRQGSTNGRLVTRPGVVIATPTEAEVFAACRMPFIPPHERTGRVVG